MRFLLLLLSLTFGLSGAHQLSAQILTPVKWSMDYEHVGGDEYVLIFKAKIDQGWAIYSQYLESDEGPIPTSFQYDEGDHFQLIGENEESGGRIEGMDPVFEMNVIKYKKTATFTQKVKVSDNSKPITGWLTFMTCDDTRCLPPTDVDFSFKLKPQTPASGQVEEAPGQDAKPSSKEEQVAVEEDKQKPPVEEIEEITEIEAADNSLSLESLPAEEEGILNPAKWSFSKEKVSETGYDLIFTVNLDEGWSLYSQFTEDNGPIPTTFYYDEGDHFELKGEAVEKGDLKEGPDPVFGNIIVKKYTHGPVVFTQRVQVSDPSQAITGSVSYMVCDDERCIPIDEPFTFNLLSDETTYSADPAVNAGPTNLDLDGTPMDYSFDYTLAETSCEDEDPVEEDKSSLWLIFLLGFGGGLIALLTPCVFPMVPLTVSFFTKSSSTKAKGLRNAITYGLSIIVIYVTLGLAITGIFGADALNLLSTNAWFNIAFAVLFIVFAFSFFGFFEITLPSSWANKSDRAADKGGLIGIFFMAFTLSLVSFSCTGPIIGTLLVETATGSGGPSILGRIPLGPLVGMFGFSFALALPFGLFAAFPSWLNSLPRSGSWMNSVKVTLGFIEIALALKFLSIADLTMGWKFMPYELFLGLWILCALGLGLYFLGILRFPHDSPVKRLDRGRIIMSSIALLLVVYISTGFRYSEKAETFITPNLLSGLAPPAGHSYIYPNECPLNINCFKDFQEGLAFAREKGKPILLDFTGHGCVNCRRMEDNVWSQKGVYELINDEYVLISLYVDERKKLDEPYTSPLSGQKRRTVGNKWADFQAIHFNRNSQPYYVLVDTEGRILNEPKAYTPDKEEYQDFLECGLDRFKQFRQQGSNLE